MDNEQEDFLNSQEFRCAMLGVKSGLAQFSIDVDDEIQAQVATSVLMAFCLGGGLEPDCLETLRSIVTRVASAKDH